MTQQHQDQIIINISPDIAEALESVLKEHLECNIDYLNSSRSPEDLDIIENQDLACEEILQQLSVYMVN